jgi:XRE family transcriptional regulator, stress-response regulator
MILLRRVIGDALRARRQSQHRTLREVSTAANVSLGYLSEIERGQKEASSELLAAICDALGAQLSELLREVSHTVAAVERTDLVPAGATRPAAPAARPAPSARPAPPATRAIAAGEGTDFRANAAGIVLPTANRKITVDGDLAVSVLQSTPLKATLRATRNTRSSKRGREVALSH